MYACVYACGSLTTCVSACTCTCRHTVCIVSALLSALLTSLYGTTTNAYTCTLLHLTLFITQHTCTIYKTKYTRTCTCTSSIMCSHWKLLVNSSHNYLINIESLITHTCTCACLTWYRMQGYSTSQGIVYDMQLRMYMYMYMEVGALTRDVHVHVHSFFS